jgi:hypothetical protein
VLRSLLDGYLRHRFAWLLVLLTLAVGVDPVLQAAGFRGRALEWMLLFALGAAVVGVWHQGASRRMVLGSGIALLAWLTMHGVAFGGGPSLTSAALGAWCLWLVGGLLSVVLKEGRVDGERICAALCVYMLAGLAFGGFFATLEAIEPGSLRGNVSGAPMDSITATYFSFVTLATLGYGDLVPVSSPARALAVLEAVFGQLYLTVLVARLVSLYSREGPGPGSA